MLVGTDIGWVLRDAIEHLLKMPEDRRLYADNLDWWAFPQSWGSTTLGFGGIGGQAITQAQTVVVRGPMTDCAVYFGTRLAYHVENPSDHFWDCVRDWQMPAVDKQEKLHRRPSGDAE